MRAVIYARYSTELQRDASIDDQIRLCRRRIEAENWTLGGTYADHAISGSIRMRPGYQKLLEDARAGRFDVVVAEALDRLSRDQEDIAALYKHLAFARAPADHSRGGPDQRAPRRAQGDDECPFPQGPRPKGPSRPRGPRSGGSGGRGLCFGYDVVREFDGSMAPARSTRPRPRPSGAS